MRTPKLLRQLAHPEKISSVVIEAELPDVAIGEICQIRQSLRSTAVVARAQVIGIRKNYAVLSIIGTSRGLTSDAVLEPTGRLLCVKTGYFMLGAIVDASGSISERLVPEISGPAEEKTVFSDPPDYKERINISQPIHTGIRVIDGLLTCGIGQRMGIFSAAGCGKTVLMQMLIDHADADVFIIGLIGERGREVTEFAEKLRHSRHRERCILIYATSDFSAVDRSNAAQIATTVAEFFRDKGKKVVLFIDSLTRYARALRDVSLAAGQSPSRRGYPASVFDSLPHLLERPGITQTGSITAFYTILMEGEEENDPLAEEIRSILDGHIILSHKLAGQGHYPAIDVLQSLSRVFGQVCEPEHQKKASKIRMLMTQLEELQILIDLGEYRPGENTANDAAVNLRNKLEQWLCQPLEEYAVFEATLRSMDLFVQNH